MYHVINHSIEGRDLFLSDKDFTYFIHLLWEFNDNSTNSHAARDRDKNHSDNSIELIDQGRNMANIRCSPLVEVHGWILMKNHYHLILSDVEQGGVSMFMRRLNNGYAKYYNDKYKRTGYVFKGRTKKILIKNNAHALYLLHYVHFNALDYTPMKTWRLRDDGKVQDAKRALDAIQAYKYSSAKDYLGEENYPSILTSEFFTGLLGDYRASAKKFLRNLEDFPSRDLE